MIQLTKETYFSPENTAISSTKVRDFLKSKELYYARYIARTLPFESTASVFIGKLVDDVIERGSLEHFKSTYQVAVLKRDDPDVFAAQKTMDPQYIISPDTYTRVIAMCDKILRSPFYQSYNPLINSGIKVEWQKPLWATVEGVDICGLLDVLSFQYVDNKLTAFIDDLKTTNSSSIRSAKTWAWHVQDYGYHRQMACYRLLVASAFPEVEHIECRHFVVGTSKADCYPLRLFRFPDSLLAKGEREFIETAKAISVEQDFIDPLPSWDEAEEIPELNGGELEIIGDDEMESL